MGRLKMGATKLFADSPLRSTEREEVADQPDELLLADLAAAAPARPPQPMMPRVHANDQREEPAWVPTPVVRPPPTELAAAPREESPPPTALVTEPAAFHPARPEPTHATEEPLETQWSVLSELSLPPERPVSARPLGARKLEERQRKLTLYADESDAIALEAEVFRRRSSGNLIRASDLLREIVRGWVRSNAPKQP